MLKITGIINIRDKYVIQQIIFFSKAVTYAIKGFKQGKTEEQITKEVTKLYLPDYIYCQSAIKKAQDLIYGKNQDKFWAYHLDSTNHPLIFARRNLKLYYSQKTKKYYLYIKISYQSVIPYIKMIPVEFNFNTRRLLKEYFVFEKKSTLIPLQSIDLMYKREKLYIRGELKEIEADLLDINQKAVAAGIMAGIVAFQGLFQNVSAETSPPVMPSFINSNTSDPNTAPPTMPSFINSNTSNPGTSLPVIPSFINTTQTDNVNKPRTTYRSRRTYNYYKPIKVAAYYPILHPVVNGNICTVSTGNSLSYIAYKVLGNADRWKEIYELNKDKIKIPDSIEIGQKLTLPTKVVTATNTTNNNTNTPITNHDSPITKYTVKAGDCLWNIAQSELKDPYKWVDIYKLNKSIISDPDSIDVGMELVLKA